jgi:SAM-dependent methyltransferase
MTACGLGFSNTLYSVFRHVLQRRLILLPQMTDLQHFYSTRQEGERLQRGVGQLESARTRELLASVLPAVPATLYDVGGGSGHYAGWLAEQGYTVHLLDPVPDHARAAAGHPHLASAVAGDARALPWPDHSADAVLLMGPLYHLTNREDRLQCLREARRVLRSDGILFAVVIPRWASALVGMLRGWTEDADYAGMVREEITTGMHRRPDSWPQLFMDGWFHTQACLEAELVESGFGRLRTAAIEGPAWMWRDFDEAWQDPERRERILELARLAEQDPEVVATSPHVAVVCRPAA